MARAGTPREQRLTAPRTARVFFALWPDDRVRDALHFHEDHSNQLEVQDGTLTGKVIPPILDRNSKLQSLLQVTAAQGFSLSDSLAAGDGANDLPMLMAAGLGVAYHAKPVVQQSARARINHCDLTALLFAQGYTREEFVI